MDQSKNIRSGDGVEPLSSATSSNAQNNGSVPSNPFARGSHRGDANSSDNDSSAERRAEFNMKKNLNVSPNPSSGIYTAQSNNKYPFGVTPEPSKESQQTFKNPFQIANERKSTKPAVIDRPVIYEDNVPLIPNENFDNKRSSILDAKPAEDSRSESVAPSEPGSNLRLENYGFAPEETVSGETVVTVVKCTAMLMQYPSAVANGTFILTNFRFIFKPAEDNFFKKHLLKSDYLNIPLGFLFKVDRTVDKRDVNISYLDIYSKDGRNIRLRFLERSMNEAHSVLQYLTAFGFPEKKDYFFAFHYNKYNRDLENKYQGWKIYDIEKEFRRQGMEFASIGDVTPNPQEYTYKLVDNRYFKISHTYPPLLLVPSKISDQSVVASSKFRTKERVPVITYYYAKTKTLLSRSSQSKPGITQTRSPEDELLLRYLGNPDFNEALDTGYPQPDLHIYDARPYLNAVANKVNGKGYEDTKCYRNCEIFFMAIDNIHHVRDAHRKLLNLCNSSEAANNKWYSQLEATNWLDLMSYILAAASKVTKSLREGRNCLVHCSDGWDRTAQLLSLAQIMLDPYFRTIDGFEVLIMKDWVSFGHQFNLRMGHGNKNDRDDQRSPIFIQFLDCVHQLMNQYPFAFEFNHTFLYDLCYHAHSCQFGTFLCNTYQEVIQYQLETRTISIWSFLNSQKERYINPFFDSVSQHSELILRPSSHLKYLRLWEENFLYYSSLSRPNFPFSDKIAFSKDFYEFMFVREKKKASNLKNEIEDLKRKLKTYETGGEANVQEINQEVDKQNEKKDTKSINEIEDIKIVREESKTNDQPTIDVIDLEGDALQNKMKDKEEQDKVQLIAKNGHLEVPADPEEEDKQVLKDMGGSAQVVESSSTTQVDAAPQGEKNDEVFI